MDNKDVDQEEAVAEAAAATDVSPEKESGSDDATEELLSEEERDALIDGVESGELGAEDTLPDGEVVAYDLASPDRIIRGRLPVLEKINTRFGLYAQDGFEQMLQRPAEVLVDSLKTVRISDYIHGLGVPASLNFVRMDPLPSEALFIFDPDLIFTIVDIYFGGNGQQKEQEEGREFTPTETRITRLVLNQIFLNLKTAWEQVLAVNFKFTRAESNPQFSSIAGSREMMLVSTFRLGLGETGGEFHIGLPFSMIEPVRGLLDGGRQKSKVEIEQVWQRDLQHNLQETMVEIQGLITGAELNLRDVFNLRVGDVIPVGLPDEVTLQVEGIPMFNGQLGAHQGHNAVRIVNRIDAGDTQANIRSKT